MTVPRVLADLGGECVSHGQLSVEIVYDAPTSCPRQLFRPILVCLMMPTGTFKGIHSDPRRVGRNCLEDECRARGPMMRSKNNAENAANDPSTTSSTAPAFGATSPAAAAAIANCTAPRRENRRTNPNAPCHATSPHHTPFPIDSDSV